MLGRAVYGGLLLGLLGLVAAVTGLPWLFPALGPTLWLRLQPSGPPSASGRNVLYGHAFGVGAGALGLALGGLVPETLQDPVAAAIAFAGTMGACHWFMVDHPPAAATTLIVALGGLPGPWGLGVAMVSVAALCGATPRAWWVKGTSD